MMKFCQGITQRIRVIIHRVGPELKKETVVLEYLI